MAPSLSRSGLFALVLGAVGLGSAASVSSTSTPASQEQAVRTTPPTAQRAPASPPSASGSMVLRSIRALDRLSVRDRWYICSPIWIGRARPRSHRGLELNIARA